ncbi:MAG: flagellar basal body L-ring protein FlgH [Planctomycetaceae bacterium]
MRTPTWLLLVATVIGLAPETVSAQYRNSLWSRRRPGRVRLFYDTQARRAGDILTILVNENTNITNNDQRQLNKGSSSSGSLGFNSNTAGGLGVSAALADIDAETNSDRDFNGASRFTSSRGFSDRLTVRVHSVLPSGNLWVVGTRRIIIEGDERSLYVSGIVRPIDILANNTVESQFVADLRMKFNGVGTESKFTRQGWLNRKINKIWPF